MAEKEIVLSKDAVTFLESIPDKQRQQIVRRIYTLKTKSHHEQLSGYKGYYKLKSGEYRVVYRFSNLGEILVDCVGKRNDDEIYKKLKNKS